MRMTKGREGERSGKSVRCSQAFHRERRVMVGVDEGATFVDTTTVHEVSEAEYGTFNVQKHA